MQARDQCVHNQLLLSHLEVLRLKFEKRVLPLHECLPLLVVLPDGFEELVELLARLSENLDLRQHH